MDGGRSPMMTREERKLWKRECIHSAVLMAALGLVALGLPNWIG